MTAHELILCGAALVLVFGAILEWTLYLESRETAEERQARIQRAMLDSYAHLPGPIEAWFVGCVLRFATWLPIEFRRTRERDIDKW